MPQIPKYYSQATVRPIETPKVPVGMAGQVGEAMARTGGVASNVGFELDARLDQVRQLEEYTKYSIDASRRIHAFYSDTLNSEEFIANPKAAKNNFNSAIDKFGNEYIAQIKDRDVRVRLQDHIMRESMSRKYAVEDAVRKQSIDSGRATTLSALNDLRDLAGKAGSVKEYKYQISRGVGLVRAMAAAGIYAQEEAVKLEQKFTSGALTNKAKQHILYDAEGAFEQLSNRAGIYTDLLEDDARPLIEMAQRRAEHNANQRRIAEERAKNEAEQQELNSALKEVQTMFPGNPQAQAKYVSNTQNYPNMDVQKLSTLLSMIDSDGRRQEREAEAEQKKTDDTFIREFYRSGKTDADIKAANISPDLIGTLIDKNRQMAERQDKTDPKIKARALSMIYNREITDMSQIARIPGIGVDSWPELERSIEEAADPSKSGYYKQAEKLFRAKMGEGHEEEPDFMMLLDHQIKTDKLKGPEIYKRAQDMLKVVEDGWFSDRLQYHRELETAPWLDLPVRESDPDWTGIVPEPPHRKPTAILTGDVQRGPIVPPGSEPVNVGPIDLGMPAGTRARMAGILQERNLPVTDANIKYLHEQYKAQGGE